MDDLEVRVETMERLIESEQWGLLSAEMRTHHPADLAELIGRADEKIRDRLFSLLDDDVRPDVLSELEERVSAEVMESLTNAELSELVVEMPPDDAADVLSVLSEERSEKVLALMESEDSRDVRALLNYEEDTAGGIMTTDFVAMPTSLTVHDAVEKLPYMEQEEPFFYMYAVDDEGRLAGWVGLWELLTMKDRRRPLADAMHRDVISVTTDTDQEECARRMSKYDLSSMPVCDEEGRLVGRILVDDVMDVMEEEASEDIFRLAGSDDEEMETSSPWRAARYRLPWLFITLASGFASSLLLKQFMNLREVLVLSFFVPIVMAMGGNTGIQSSTLIIRSLALGSLEGRKRGKILGREIGAGAVMGLACAVVLGFWARLVIGASPGDSTAYSPLYLAGAVAIALFCAMTFAAMFGACVPLLFHRLSIDPAVASGPFVTASNDILALLIYYGITLLFILLA
jgi:magnesium transporter